MPFNVSKTGNQLQGRMQPLSEMTMVMTYKRSSLDYPEHVRVAVFKCYADSSVKLASKELLAPLCLCWMAVQYL